MSHPTPLDLQSVQGTMLIPLWGRAKYSAKYPNILQDKDAMEIIRKHSFDFSGIEKTFGDFSGLCYIVRARKMDDAVRRFMEQHPKGTIVNIGAGLDTGFSRVDNGSIHWYNLDLPDSIAYRKTLLPDTERSTCIPKSFFDESWFDDIHFDKDNGILFISGGVFYYFKEEQLKAIFSTMARRFPGGEVYFDAESKTAVEKSNEMVQKTGNKGAQMYFYVNDATAIKNWSTAIREVSLEPYFKGLTYTDGLKTRAQMVVMDKAGMMKFVHVKFAD